MIKDYYFAKKENNDLKMVKNEKKNERQKKINISLVFFLFLLFVFSLQLYGFHNFSKNLNNFIVHIRRYENIINLDIKENKDKTKNKISIEYFIINEIYSFLKIKE